MPKVSVIVPIYGVESYLDKCIQSIINQSYKDWELILVDDGSPDESGEICEKYVTIDSRINVLHLLNSGVSVARNRGMAIAKGQYITFVDGDDWIEPCYLESLLRYAGESVVVYGNVINDYSDGTPSSIVFDYTEGACIKLEANEQAIIKYHILENGFPVSKLFSADVIRTHKLTFDENLSYHEDHLFVLGYLSVVGTVILSSKPIYHYEHRGGNVSLSKRPHSAKKMIDASSKLINALEYGNIRWKISDKLYLKRLYTFLGLNQLIIALKNASSQELYLVSNAIRDRFKIFHCFYSPNHYVYKIIPYLIACHTEIIYRLILQWKEKHL